MRVQRKLLREKPCEQILGAEPINIAGVVNRI
jgi:hypothetical protein